MAVVAISRYGLTNQVIHLLFKSRHPRLDSILNHGTPPFPNAARTSSYLIPDADRRQVEGTRYRSIGGESEHGG
jgi:hypothetical protein